MYPSPYLEWFYRLSTSGRTANVLQRERRRRSRLLSTVVLVLSIFIVLVIPATLFIHNSNTFHICLAMLVICVIALIFNRRGKTLLAGSVLVITCELGFIAVISTTVPFDTLNLPLYDLMAVVEILAVSLLPPRSVFLVAFFNAAFTTWSLLFQMHTPGFRLLLETQFYNCLIRPTSLQLVVAIVTYLFVTSINQTVIQLDRAQAVADLEHDLANTMQKIANQKNALEVALVKLYENMTDILNYHPPRTAIEDFEPLFWPLQTTLEQIQVRLEKARRSENILNRIMQVKDDPLALRILLDEQSDPPVV